MKIEVIGTATDTPYLELHPENSDEALQVVKKLKRYPEIWCIEKALNSSQKDVIRIKLRQSPSTTKEVK